MARSFRIADDDRSGFLCWEEFNKAMNDFRVALAHHERQELFRAFDINHNNHMSVGGGMVVVARAAFQQVDRAQLPGHLCEAAARAAVADERQCQTLGR